MADEQDGIEPTRFTIERLLKLRDHEADVEGWVALDTVVIDDTKYPPARKALDRWLAALADNGPAIVGPYRVIEHRDFGDYVHVFEVYERREITVEAVERQPVAETVA